MTVTARCADIFALQMMITPQPDFLSNFYIAGINYRKSDVFERGKFSLTEHQSALLLQDAVTKELAGAFVISTCNRTEIYSICSNLQELKVLLCKHTQGEITDFEEHGYVHRGIKAVDHLFKMAAGIDSQIIGDHEILSQLKIAARFAKNRNCLNSFLERVVNFAIASSKRIKTETKLSSGTVSVSYAAVDIIKEKFTALTNKKIVLLGTGKFGNNIASNLKTYLPDCLLTFCNRTDEKALELAQKTNAGFSPFDNISVVANDSDVVIVSTSATCYTILPTFFTTKKTRLILDLSIPQNVDPAVKNITGIELLNVDEISAILNKTIFKRKAEIPKALQIINETIEDFKCWNSMQGNNSVLRKIKIQLNEIACKDQSGMAREKIQQTVSSLAIQLRKENNKGCQYLHALNNYLHTDYEFEN